jgi:Fic family protein
MGRLAVLGLTAQDSQTMEAATTEAIATAAIEGERLPPDEVRSSVARRLGLDAAALPPASRSVDGLVEMMLDATQRFDAPLTAERVCAWHAALFPTGRAGMHPLTVGRWRPAESDPMQVVSGPMGRERVHFEAPEAVLLDDEMARFLAWCARPPAIDGLILAGLAHLWFATIHPFEDGNGRIARAVADHFLARADGSRQRYFSMSAEIARDRAEYYAQLERAQRGSLDVTAWLVWFVAHLDAAVRRALSTQQAALDRAERWRVWNAHPLNARQRAVLERVSGEFEGVLNNRKYRLIAGCSDDTALRDLTQLVAWGVLVPTQAGGRSRGYGVV